MDKIDIGRYAKDTRLGSHEAAYASFHGESCDEGVLVLAAPSGNGSFAVQRTKLDSDGELEHVWSSEYETAYMALRGEIGPVKSS